MRSQLQLLRTFCYILAGINLLGVLFLTAFIGLGVYDSFFTGRPVRDDDICALICLTVCLLLIGASCIGNFLCAGWLMQGRRYQFCMTVTICNLIPVTGACFVGSFAAGVFGLVVLLDKRIKYIFRRVEAGESVHEVLAEVDSSYRKPPDDSDDIDVSGGWDEVRNK